MPRRILFLATVLALALPTAASAAPTAVDVRIEGKTSTIFNQPVTTDGKVITTASGGTHLCDGSTASPPVGPGPTPNTALDDAAIKGGFTWDGPWFGTDFFASRIAGETESLADGHFWGVFVNGSMLPVGGCQWILQPGDEVLWAYDAFSKTGGALTLTGEEATQTDRPLRVRVTKTGPAKAPVAGAKVGSATTGPDGTALVSFDKPGIYRIKAEKALYVRSDEIRVCVDPPLVEACTSTDRKAPSVRLDAPAIASTDGRYGFVRLSWQGDDGTDGSGVRRYRVDRRRAGSKSGIWHRVALDTTKTLARVPAREGTTYEYRVAAIDRAGNFSPYATARSAMPRDNLSSDLRLSKDWTTLRRQGAFKLTVSRAKAKGASASMRFSGTGATLVTRKLPRGGKVRITLDGKSKVVSLKGRGRFRRKLIGTADVPAGPHTLRIVSLSRAPVEIDAVAIRP